MSDQCFPCFVRSHFCFVSVHFVIQLSSLRPIVDFHSLSSPLLSLSISNQKVICVVMLIYVLLCLCVMAISIKWTKEIGWEEKKVIVLSSHKGIESN